MDTLISFAAHGLTQASWGTVILYTLAVTHLTIIGVTLFLHRSQTHRGVDLHPIVAHVLRFWLWLTTGMVTKEWVAIHRKHHAYCEREGDPHSPMIYGINRVLFQGAELYREESANAETLKRFGHGTPDDWIERNLYARHTTLGIFLMLGINLALFGVLGLTVWAIQMAWIPFWAAGVVNGLGHFWGYRNFASPDTSTNVSPIGIIIGGEELHNNHHAHGTSAKFSSKWYEFDIGWMYIQILRAVGLAKVRRVAPKLKLDNEKPVADLGTLEGVLAHRYEIMARYTRLVKRACGQEMVRLRAAGGELATLKNVRRLLHLPDAKLAPEQHAQIQEAVTQAPRLAVMVQMRRDLGRLWESSSATSEQLLHDLQTWCQRAQQSGIDSLEQFSQRLRRYAA